MTSAFRTFGDPGGPPAAKPYYKCPICANSWSWSARTDDVRMETLRHAERVHGICVWQWGKWKCVCGTTLWTRGMIDHYTKEHVAECVMLVSAGHKPQDLP